MFGSDVVSFLNLFVNYSSTFTYGWLSNRPSSYRITIKSKFAAPQEK